MIAEPASEDMNIDEEKLYKEVAKDINVNRLSEEATNLAKKYGYLPYMVQRYIDMLGYEETIELLDTFENFQFHPVILCNVLRIKCKELIERLIRLGFEIRPISWCDYSYIVTKTASKPSLGSTHEYLKGFYYVYRDASSLLPVLALSPEPKSTVLDMCAAPGGKSVHILIKIMDRGLLVANDVSKTRLNALVVNLFRMGFKSYVVIAEDAITLPKKINMLFDYVLLDAPCSAEGAIMFDKSRKTKTSQKDLVRLVMREIKLLLSAINIVKHGGRIAYATCSIAPEENEYVITKVMELANNYIEIEKPEVMVGDEGLKKFRQMEFYSKTTYCIRIWPHRHLMEGYFICILKKL